MTEPLPRSWVLRPLPEIAQVNPPLDCSVSGDGTPVTFVPMRAVGVEGAGIEQVPPDEARRLIAEFDDPAFSREVLGLDDDYEPFTRPPRTS